MNKILSIAVCLVALPFLVKGQDFHWSLIHLNPTYLNPANTGFAKKKNRVTGLYRDQWRSIPVPYSTTNVSYDRNVFHNEESGWRLGLGAQLLFDKAGDGALTTFRPAVSAAIGKYFNSNKQLIQLGINGAYARKQIDFSKLTFNAQFDGVNYNPEMSNGEDIVGDKAGYFDLGLGFNFNSKLKKIGDIDLGVSSFNLTSPKYNFLSGSEATVAPRVMAYTKANIDLGASAWSFHPGVYYQNQNKAQETLLQTIFGVKLGESKNTQLQFGPGYRIGDAVVGYVGLNWKDLKVGFAFDGNVSDLKTATSGRGAYELALNYEWERKKKPEPELFEPPIVEEPKVEEPQVEDTIIVPEPEFVVEVPKVNVVDSLTEVVKLRAAVELFYANDQPNPRTRDTSTNVSYDETYQSYVQELGKLVNDKDAQFAVKVKSANDELESLLKDVHQLLKENKSVVAEVRGFASPLASSSYNVNLTKRRAVALINYLKKWNNGALLPYITNGQLNLDQKAYGAAQAADEISSDPKDKQKSIYSTDAAYERRVELKVIEVK
ncbi:MAG: PorP/SprF family type IX secretion system membrane protein [Chitinophagales bacterium]|nr:PorP/SprF family type IX secretion system membrane protein [Chitinophagales bacterium]